MDCGCCGASAVYVCLCVKVRLCDDCFVQHCESYPENEHQLIPVEECSETYTVEELKARPELCITKIEEEITRLESYRETVLHLLETLCTAETTQHAEELVTWTELLVAQTTVQREALQSALRTLGEVPLIEKLPAEGFPWSLVSVPGPESFLPEGIWLGSIVVGLETAIQTQIHWNLPEMRSKVPGNPTISPNTLTPTLPQPSIEPEILDLPTDTALKMQKLQQTPTLRTAYFRFKRQDPAWTLRYSFLPDGQLQDESKLIAKEVGKTDFLDLILVLSSHSASLKTLILTGCSFTMDQFEQLCETISPIPLISLVLERCKLANSHIVKLQANFSVSLQVLNLNSNYFTPSILSFERVPGLIRLEIRNLPGTSGLTWPAGLTVLKDEEVNS